MVLMKERDFERLISVSSWFMAASRLLIARASFMFLSPLFFRSLSLLSLFAVHVVSVLLQVPGNVSQALGRFSEVSDACQLRIGVFLVCLPSYWSFSSRNAPPSSLLLSRVSSAWLSFSFLACSPYPLRQRR